MKTNSNADNIQQENEPLDLNKATEFTEKKSNGTPKEEQVVIIDTVDGPLFNQTTAIEKPLNNGLVNIDLNADNLPDLNDFEVVPLDLVGNYWTPEMPGENKRVYFDCIQVSQFKQPEEEDVVIELETAFFFEKSNGTVIRYCNASKRLVAALKQNHVERGNPILITYMGKKKNSSNQFKSDIWSIKPLMIKAK